MKHLKRFNESEMGDDIQEMCDNYLSFLKDSGYRIYVNTNSLNVHIHITISYLEYDSPKLEWVDISDDFIQFLELLSAKYSIAYDNVIFTGYEPRAYVSQYNRTFKVEDVINNVVPEYAKFDSVTMQINHLK